MTKCKLNSSWENNIKYCIWVAYNPMKWTLNFQLLDIPHVWRFLHTPAQTCPLKFNLPLFIPLSTSPHVVPFIHHCSISHGTPSTPTPSHQATPPPTAKWWQFFSFPFNPDGLSPPEMLISTFWFCRYYLNCWVLPVCFDFIPGLMMSHSVSLFNPTPSEICVIYDTGTQPKAWKK